MRAFVRTRYTGTGTLDDPKRPYLPAEDIFYSVLDLGEKCIAAISGEQHKVEEILQDPEIEVLSDSEVWRIIRSINPQADLEDLAVRDKEIDIIARELGIDPYAVRKSKDKPTVGRRVLHEQEAELMKNICENLGLTREFWDTVAGGGKWTRGLDIGLDLKRGRVEAHEIVMGKILKKI